MADKPRFFQTTAIDYPNSRPHIGTAFEKIGADVQARYRRMEGFDVFFLMGNDENTVKVSSRAAELGQFKDAPLGICGASAFNASATQNIRVLLNGTPYAVRTNLFSFSGSAVGSGTINSVPDISKSRP
jgi:hypothetical protein